MAAYGINLPMYASALFSMRLILAITYVVVATLLFWRRSKDTLALFGAYMLLTWGVIDTRFILVASIQTLWWYVYVQSIGFIAETILIYFFALFPTGRFAPRAMRWLAPALAAF